MPGTVPPAPVGISLCLLAATLLSGCATSTISLPAACSSSTSPPPQGPEVQVYFGCGCFWHVQHGFVSSEISDLCRQDSNITARTAYAGGTHVGSGGLVCYHNFQGVADYGSMGHAEVVAMTVPEEAFGRFASKFWELCKGGNRADPQDAGGEYRSVVGLPGGIQSPLMAQLREGAGQAQLVAGNGNEGDTYGTGQVFVYDTAKFPAHTAEKYHQFHDDMLESYGYAYNSLQRFAAQSRCPNDGARLLLG